MPTVLILGSGPIVIGQAAEFDYSGSQALRALRELGWKTLLLNSNPATIMTDAAMADKVFLMPMTVESVQKILDQEKVDKVLPTMGGQTALNLAMECQKLWSQYGIEVIGADMQAIEIAESREAFRLHAQSLGLPLPPSKIAHSYLQAKETAQELGYPVVIRPSYTLGGLGAAEVHDKVQLEKAVGRALALSPIHQVLIEKSLYGWKEFELEVLRDKAGNFIVVCSIENIDPMGIHTGDSITVAPAQTLSDPDLQRMRTTARTLLSSFENFAGGCNIQFALNPQDGTLYLIEINPRVSRSSALASKATGYPIAKIAAYLAAGYTLDQVKNPITQTSAAYEPSLDYVVVKIPRWNFDKFPGANRQLGMQMRSVGEAMGIGRNFCQALQKAVQSLEVNRNGLGADGREIRDLATLLDGLEKPSWNRLFLIHDALLAGVPLKTIHKLTHIDEWFLHQIQEIVLMEQELATHTIETLTPTLLQRAKLLGFGDRQISHLVKALESQIFHLRQQYGIAPVYKQVDTCAAEFPAFTPYFYSSYEREGKSDNIVSSRPKILILGSGPNRIGQGIEFDYCCVHGLWAVKACGYEALMLNCNPETVSTDPDVSDKLFFEPVFWEYVYEVILQEKPRGVIISLGGQTPLKLAEKLHRYGVPLIGTSYNAIDTAEDRGKFSRLLEVLGIPYPPYGVARRPDEAIQWARQLGYPVLVRPSYVLGGQRMRIVVDEEELIEQIVTIHKDLPGNAILIDRFLAGATEAEVDAIYDGDSLRVIGVMEHIEPAGIHSGDSHAVTPPFSLPAEVIRTMTFYTEKIARALEIRGLINIQFAIHEGKVYVIEANPRASRTVPFLSKVYQQPFVSQAVKVMLDVAKNTDFPPVSSISGYAIKVPIFSFEKFPEIEKTLGPEMRSTGENIYFIETLEDSFFRRLYEIRSLYLSR